MNSKNPLDVQIGGNHYKTMVIQPVEFSTVNKLVLGNRSGKRGTTHWILFIKDSV